MAANPILRTSNDYYDTEFCILWNIVKNANQTIASAIEYNCRFVLQFRSARNNFRGPACQF